ncbi:MAG TPA: DUF2513 domain-containing protein [Ignavibacteriaceae bacterium]|nr:DUF2513 domain-containing protein [Ignavibacteriaceae bacterium]
MGRDERLIYEILQIIEENPYCSSSVITIKGYDNQSVLKHIMNICRENLIIAEPAADESGETENFMNMHLTLRGLLYLKKLDSISA